jgi:hypothetical protein
MKYARSFQTVFTQQTHNRFASWQHLRNIGVEDFGPYTDISSIPFPFANEDNLADADPIPFPLIVPPAAPAPLDVKTPTRTGTPSSAAPSVMSEPEKKPNIPKTFADIEKLDANGSNWRTWVTRIKVAAEAADCDEILSSEGPLILETQRDKQLKAHFQTCQLHASQVHFLQNICGFVSRSHQGIRKV